MPSSNQYPAITSYPMICLGYARLLGNAGHAITAQDPLCTQTYGLAIVANRERGQQAVQTGTCTIPAVNPAHNHAVQVLNLPASSRCRTAPLHRALRITRASSMRPDRLSARRCSAAAAASAALRAAAASCACASVAPRLVGMCAGLLKRPHVLVIYLCWHQSA